MAMDTFLRTKVATTLVNWCFDLPLLENFLDQRSQASGYA